MPAVPPAPQSPCARDKSRRGSRAHLAVSRPTTPQELSLGCHWQRQPMRNCQKTGTKLWRERDSNPRRAFDPYTLSRADHESTAVYAIMEIGLFRAILSTPVHSRLWKTFRTVPCRQLSTHGRSVSQALPGSPGAPARAVPAAARCRCLPKFSTKSGQLARSLSRTRQKAAAPRAWRSARILRSQKAGRHWLVLERS
jgi:hypothetical protein